MDHPDHHIMKYVGKAMYVTSASINSSGKYGNRIAFTRAQWQAARDELENPFTTPDEDEAWLAAEERMDIMGHNGGTGEHHEAPASKYHVQIKGQWVDVYDIIVAYEVTNPADQHAIKKMLCPGKRGAKDGIQDRREAIASLERAIELECGE